MKKYGIIYKITNKINKKVYIGQTINDFDTRYHSNIEKNTHSEEIKKDIKKYGIKNFEIIKEFDVAYSKEELDEKEIFYIDLYDSFFSGYNKTLGGDMRCQGIYHPASKPVVCLNTKQEYTNIFEAAKTLNANVNSISRCCRGEYKRVIIKNKSFSFVFKTDYEKMTEKEISDKIFEAKTSRNRVVYCLNDDKKHSLDEAAKIYNISKESIMNYCKGGTKILGEKNGKPLMFIYFDDYEKLSKEEIEKIKEETMERFCKKRVVCLNNKKIYKTPSEVAKELNIHRANVTNHLKGRRMLPCGLRFVYLYEFLNGRTISRYEEMKMKNEKEKKEKNKIKCLTTEEVLYKEEACKKYKISPQALYAHLNKRTKSCGRHPITNEKLVWETIKQIN